MAMRAICHVSEEAIALKTHDVVASFRAWRERKPGMR
jgi:hypothetical protein